MTLVENNANKSVASDTYLEELESNFYKTKIKNIGLKFKKKKSLLAEDLLAILKKRGDLTPKETIKLRYVVHKGVPPTTLFFYIFSNF